MTMSAFLKDLLQAHGGDGRLRYLPDPGHNPHVPDRGDGAALRGEGPVRRRYRRPSPQAIMNERQQKIFSEEHEMNLALYYPDLGRFRVNIFRQRGNVGLVLRQIKIHMKTVDELGLPQTLKEIVMTQARPRSRGRGHGQRKIDDPRRHDRPQEREPAGAHHHHRGPHRVHPSPQEERGHAAGGGLRHATPFSTP